LNHSGADPAYRFDKQLGSDSPSSLGGHYAEWPEVLTIPLAVTQDGVAAPRDEDLVQTTGADLVPRGDVPVAGKRLGHEDEEVLYAWRRKGLNDQVAARRPGFCVIFRHIEVQDVTGHGDRFVIHDKAGLREQL
jgi:hypothetical protein